MTKSIQKILYGLFFILSGVIFISGMLLRLVLAIQPHSILMLQIQFAPKAGTFQPLTIPIKALLLIY